MYRTARTLSNIGRWNTRGRQTRRQFLVSTTAMFSLQVFPVSDCVAMCTGTLYAGVKPRPTRQRRANPPARRHKSCLCCIIYNSQLGWHHETSRIQLVMLTWLGPRRIFCGKESRLQSRSSWQFTVVCGSRRLFLVPQRRIPQQQTNTHTHNTSLCFSNVSRSQGHNKYNGQPTGLRLMFPPNL